MANRQTYQIEDRGHGPSSEGRRKRFRAEAKELRGQIEALKEERAEIIAAHTRLQELGSEIRKLNKRRDAVLWRGFYYRFRAYRDGGVPRTTIAEGDSKTECARNAKARGEA